MEPLKTKLGNGKTAVLHCLHASMWPPVHTRLAEPIEAQRAAGLLDDLKYEQIKTWQRVCGLQEMAAGKCLGCPHARVERGEGELRELTAAELPKKVGRKELPKAEPTRVPFARAKKGRV